MDRVFIVIILAGIILSSICMGYSGGAGTADNPYQIADVDDLLELAADTGNYDKCFILTADIDLAGQMFTKAVIASGSDYSPVFTGTPFTGIFDGDNFTIHNLTINLSSRTGYQIGLFGRLGVGAKVKDLNISNGYIYVGTGSQDIGLLAGDNYKGIISGCTVHGEIIAGYDNSFNIGGLTGVNSGLLYCCNSYCTIQAKPGTDRIGGMVGVSEYIPYDSDSHRISCIIRCYSSSSVQGGDYVGGMVGRLGGYLVQCSSDSAVYGSRWVGGLIGGGASCFLMNCFTAGDVYGDSNCGGLMGGYGFGIDPTIIRNCYSLSTVSVGEGGVAGGLASYGTGSIEACYYLAGAGPDNGFGTPLTDAQMRDPNSFVGWDFSGSFDDGSSDFWKMPTGGEYPVFNLGRIGFYDWTTNSGMGTQDDPYVISNALELLSIGWNPELMDRHFILASDIDLQAYPLREALISPFWMEFYGSLDGRGHTISNFTIIDSKNDGVGLVGCIDNGGSIRNVGLVNTNVAGLDFVGGLCGDNYKGTISQCYVIGEVTGGYFNIGGLCGDNYSGQISQCYTQCTVNSSLDQYAVGGLCGYNENGIINQCYAAGTVTGGFGPSGLCGLCGYQTGNSAVMQNSFWDVETSGLTVGYNLVSSSSGTIINVAGKTTAQMKTLSTFTDAGWDFAETWGIGNGQTYPYLKPFNGVNPADINSSGSVDMADLAILAAHWLEGV